MAEIGLADLSSHNGIEFEDFTNADKIAKDLDYYCPRRISAFWKLTWFLSLTALDLRSRHCHLVYSKILMKPEQVI